MKVKNLGIVLLFYCWNNSGKAQNLIPNNSFETFLQCPTQADQGPAAVPWGSGNTYIFPELFNSCATLSSIVSVPVNLDSMLGYQNAHSGDGYAGINVYQDTNPFPIDYLQVPLTDSLDSGKYYCLTFYLSLANNSRWGVDAVAAYFSNQPSSLCSTFTCVLTYTPQVSNPAGNILLDTLNWMQIQGCFQAQGGEKYMIIGNFKNNAQTQKALNKPSGFNWSTYYYVDDVSLYEDTTLGVQAIPVENYFSIHPNPCDNYITLSYHDSDLPNNLSIIDLSGKRILEFNFSKSEKTIDVSSVASGYYILKCGLASGKTIVRKITISHQ